MKLFIWFFLSLCIFSVVSHGEQKKVLLYLYSSEVTDSDFSLDHLTRYERLQEGLKNLMANVDPEIEVVAIDIEKAVKMQASPSSCLTVGTCLNARHTEPLSNQFGAR